VDGRSTVDRTHRRGDVLIITLGGHGVARCLREVVALQPTRARTNSHSSLSLSLSLSHTHTHTQQSCCDNYRLPQLRYMGRRRQRKHREQRHNYSETHPQRDALGSKGAHVTAARSFTVT
jgi:hypothetical protein